MEQRHNDGAQEKRRRLRYFRAWLGVFLILFFFLCFSLALVGCQYAEFKKTRFGSFITVKHTFSYQFDVMRMMITMGIRLCYSISK
jgi:hypothetical protein